MLDVKNIERMVKKWFLLLCMVNLITGVFWPNQLLATKPDVPLEQCIKRADVIVVAEIKFKAVIEKPRKNLDGNWLPMRQRVSAKLKDILKNDLEKDIQKDIQFDCGPLTFEEGKTFILFLKNKNTEATDGLGEKAVAIFDFISPPAIRIEATRNNVDNIKKIIAKQQ